MNGNAFAALVVATLLIIFVAAAPRAASRALVSLLLLGLAAALYAAARAPARTADGGSYKEEQVRGSFTRQFQFPTAVGPARWPLPAPAAGAPPPVVLPWLGDMELDGYNETLGVAFEFQGPRHYGHRPLAGRENQRVVPRLNPWDPAAFVGARLSAAEARLVATNMQHPSGSYAKFRRAAENDERKRALCAANGVTLIAIPHAAVDGKGEGHIDAYVRSRLADAGVGARWPGYVPEVPEPGVDLTEYVLEPLPEWDPNNYTTPVEGSAPPAFHMPGSFRYYRPSTGQFLEPPLKTPAAVPRWIQDKFRGRPDDAKKGAQVTNGRGAYRWIPGDWNLATVYNTQTGSFMTFDTGDVADVTDSAEYTVAPRRA